MTAAETIEQAIARLETLDAATPSRPWSSWRQQGPFGNERFGIEYRGGVDIADVITGEIADLLAAMVGTFDAQLAILRAGLAAHSPGDDTTEEIEAHALALARAILGEES